MELAKFNEKRSSFDAILITNQMREHIQNFLSSRLERELSYVISEDVTVFCPGYEGKGHRAYREAHRLLRERLSKGTFALLRSRYANDHVSFWWKAQGLRGRIEEGQCTSIFRNGKIVRHTLDYKFIQETKD